MHPRPQGYEPCELLAALPRGAPGRSRTCLVDLRRVAPASGRTGAWRLDRESNPAPRFCRPRFSPESRVKRTRDQPGYTAPPPGFEPGSSSFADSRLLPAAEGVRESSIVTERPRLRRRDLQARRDSNPHHLSWKQTSFPWTTRLWPLLLLTWPPSRGDIVGSRPRQDSNLRGTA